ncbi:MAG: DUF6020 family protein [Anaerostipes sp.]|nr:DUF6020 family protein [Anaerostipes sp.]
MQQVARNVKYHKKDISKKDEQRIRRILHYDTLGKDYNPDLSDPIKSYVSYSVMGAVKNISGDDVKEFMIAWSHGLKQLWQTHEIIISLIRQMIWEVKGIIEYRLLTS